MHLDRSADDGFCDPVLVQALCVLGELGGSIPRAFAQLQLWVMGSPSQDPESLGECSVGVSGRTSRSAAENPLTRALWPRPGRPPLRYPSATVPTKDIARKAL